jgi:hypothetical protein
MCINLKGSVILLSVEIFRSSNVIGILLPGLLD